MKERIPGIIALVILLILVGGTWWAADYTQRAVHIEAPRRLTHEPDAWSENFVMIRTDPAGIPVNRLEGVYMQHYPDDDSYEITTATATGQRPGSPITIAQSDTAIMDEDGSRVTLTGNAHLHRVADADRAALDIHSDTLILLPDDDIVYTDLAARIKQGQSTLQGTGMRYNNKTRILDVHSATDAKLSGQNRQPGRKPSSSSRNTP